MDEQVSVFLYSIGRISSFTLSLALTVLRAAHRPAAITSETGVSAAENGPQRRFQPSLPLLRIKK
ncbi:hypothetical protein [Paraburkholderia phosphatilytica]|uniref:hypothetical protein n=1 Tax=Paraburkholderia phosphatilytica TaxID=2282883 RepID=UPI0013E03E1D|nr:hypothetical protein [Paraburkholderia phosphatilytica]